MAFKVIHDLGKKILIRLWVPRVMRRLKTKVPALVTTVQAA